MKVVSAKIFVSSNASSQFLHFLANGNSFLQLLLQLFSHEFLTLFRVGLFRDAHGWGAKRPPPLPKICYIHPTMMKLGTVVPYLKKIKKYINHVTHSMSPANICIFSLEICNFCYIKKYRYRLHFNNFCP